MRKRIKARLKRTKPVPGDYAKEIYKYGKKIACYSHFIGEMRAVRIEVSNIRYLGKKYFVVVSEKTDECGDRKIDCLEI